MTSVDGKLLEWKQRLRELETEHSKNQLNIEVASALWSTLDGGVGNNLKGIVRAVRVFGASALASPDGVEKLAGALSEVFETTGQLPTASDFDGALYSAITSAQIKSPTVQWLIDAIS